MRENLHSRLMASLTLLITARRIMSKCHDGVFTMLQRHASNFALFVFAVGLKSLAQTPASLPQVAMAQTEQRILRSSTNGATYQIDVALPRGYSSSGRRYPVFYTLDGNAYFALVTDTVRLLRSGQQLIPEDLIVVGIGYPDSKYAWWSDEYEASRLRDYSTKPTKPLGALGNPMPPKRVAQSGGAPAFLRFLQRELIPFIDSTYRTIPGDRGLAGHSLGGLFCVYVLTHAPATFSKYAIGSPSLWWDDRVSSRWESEYASAHRDLPARVYLYVGGLEGEVMTGPPRQLWGLLQSRHYIGLDMVSFAMVPGESHTSENISSIEQALRSLYAARSISLPVEVLKRYVGVWKSNDGDRTWVIHLDGNRLLVNARRGLPIMSSLRNRRMSSLRRSTTTE